MRPKATVLVLTSHTNGRSSPVGAATAIGFVPSMRSRPNVGTTHGDAFVATMPIMPASAIRSAYKHAAPKCLPSRTATTPTPVASAFSIARSVARTAVTAPSTPCPSTSAVAAGLAHDFERPTRLHVATGQPRHVSGVRGEVRDAVGVEPEEVGLHQQLRSDGCIGLRDSRRDVHRRRELAQRRARRSRGLRHGSPAWGTSTRIVRITPVPLPAT